MGFKGCMTHFKGYLTHFDTWFGTTFLARFFQMEERGTTFFREFGGAVATFMTMAYILAVNPRILSDSGGPCVPDAPEDGGIFGPLYTECIQQLKIEYITATAVGSAFACIVMGCLANLPIALAPGMGMNAYFTYSVVGFRGTGKVSWDAACTAVLIEGAIFFVLAMSGLRSWIVRHIPEPVRLATPAAIGFFLAHLGLQTAEGIGVVVSDVATAVTLGACPEDKRTPMVAFTEECAADSLQCVRSDAYTCDVLGGVMTSPTTYMGILGMMIMLILMAYKWRSAMIVGISFITITAWFRDTPITYFPNTPAGDERFDYFRQVVAVSGMENLWLPYTSDISGAIVALFTFLYVDFLDTSGTLMGIIGNMGLLDENHDFPRSRAAFSVDALSTMFGSLMGMSPITSYVESASGVAAGSRTGLTACFVGLFFLISIFFAPLIASIPPWATGGALILVGSMMARSLVDVQWNKITHAATAFVTVAVMPLTYSIANGLIAGICMWIVLELTFWVLKFVGVQHPDVDHTNIEENFDDTLGEGGGGDGTKDVDKADKNSKDSEEHIKSDPFITQEMTQEMSSHVGMDEPQKETA